MVLNLSIYWFEFILNEIDIAATDALEGFDKPIVPSKPNVEKIQRPDEDPTDVAWSEEFMLQASQEFEKNIRTMMTESGLGGDSDFTESLMKVSQEAASKVFENQSDNGVSFADTLRSLAEGTESLQVGTFKLFLSKI